MSEQVVLTGAFGFIGSNVLEALNQRGIVPFVIDRWKHGDSKWRNIAGLRFKRITEGDLDDSGLFPTKPVIIALGASVDTRESMSETLWENNVESIIRLYRKSSRLIYASSAATYGAEESDFTERVEGLRPLNPYAQTKLSLDTYFAGKADAWGLRFFNVFGPREAHKGDMASLVAKGLLKQAPLYKQDLREPATKSPRWSLFESPTTEPIERDFIYVGDVTKVVLHFLDHPDIASGLYNVGTGKARFFEDLVRTIEKLPIDYVPIPDALKHQYQAHTRADLTRLREVAGYKESFLSLEEGIEKTREWMKRERPIT